MRVPMLSTARFAVLVALILLLFPSGIVVGAAGAPLILGESNFASGQVTSLASSTDTSGEAVLKLINAGAGRALEARSDTTAPLKIVAPAGKPPMTVNQTTRVAKLNADMVDGLHSASFHQYGASVPLGNTLTGTFIAEGLNAPAAGEFARTTISFAVPTAFAVVPHVIEPGAPTPADCSGDVSAPGADAGHLCIFVAEDANVAGYVVFDPTDPSASPGTSRFGAYLRIGSAAAGDFRAWGSWAVSGNVVFVPFVHGGDLDSDAE